ncbi:epimerase family protein SDR39U1 homolog, chloroplastic-like isoform X2 [Panicum virgatum]|uniref:epimerase family protein SDR39U1 homolog, chloroplastic-like isoform X2 n=1 Tax=Panicum virgatum TaxID=38727 RepID=UPI0019D4F025|nr:epimerase family protein SDR39U1 homolog, chloroplastic-like isoform X2 [Panicum virgatum]
MGFPTPFLQLKPKQPPVGGYPRSRRHMHLRCALNSENPPMTVSITGATGFIGRRLVQKLLSDDHKVFVLTRSATKAASVFPVSTYPGVTIAEQGDWEACVRGSSAVVNLAGMPISTKWSPEIKQEIKRSRVNVTSKVVKYINHAGNADVQPSVFVSATAIGYYGTSEVHSFDESSPSGNDYLAEVCREWEATARQVNQQDVRLVLLRIGVVLGKDGGALAKMIPLFMMFAGGPLGTGRQWFSWIHLDDLVNLIYESLINPAYKDIEAWNSELALSSSNISCLAGPGISIGIRHQYQAVFTAPASPSSQYRATPLGFALNRSLPRFPTRGLNSLAPSVRCGGGPTPVTRAAPPLPLPG